MSGSLITTSEAAVLLHKSQRTVQRLADKGVLPNVRRLPNGHYLFDLEVVEAKAAELEIGPVEQLDLGLSAPRLAGLWPRRLPRPTGSPSRGLSSARLLIRP